MNMLIKMVLSSFSCFKKRVLTVIVVSEDIVEDAIVKSILRLMIFL